jgi:ABC-type multidrug transport system fused ATPase/permease subunit
MLPESIGENISCVRPGEKDEKALEKACENAEILEFIQSLPDKFDSMLSESAENVSGGQRQRLSIARAFYKDAPAVLFDEATSALDSVTEGEILTAMESLMENRTVLIVAHRPKAIAYCDTIVMMEQGRVAGIGGHDELMAVCVPYARLYKSIIQEEAS